jgi:CDP-glucose 4,6-dehydratase
MVSAFRDIYRGKRVLVTGHTGFKGGWLSLWLQMLGAETVGFSLPPPDGHSLFSILPESCFVKSTLADLRHAEAVKKAVAEFAPDIIFHLAAQPIVGLSYNDPLATFTANALGTALLLEAVREVRCSASVVIVTSDKCYRNDNSGAPFVESDPLGGHDVYSMSKAATELVVTAWHSSFFAKDNELGPIATGRAGNVIGGGDYAVERIIPDAVRAFESQLPLVLRRPGATRPWQHVLESVSGYLTLGQSLLTRPNRAQLQSFNFGPDFEAERSVQELLNAWLSGWPEAFKLHVTPQPAFAEAMRLSLDSSKAKRELGWLPVWNFNETVTRTAEWYRLRHEAGSDAMTMLDFTQSQIVDYSRAAQLAGAAWTI